MKAVTQENVSAPIKVQVANEEPFSRHPANLTIYVGSPPKGEESDAHIWPSVISATGSILSSAAWPIGIVVVALMFKKQISALIGRIKSFKGPGGIEITTEELINNLPSSPPQQETAQAQDVEEVARLSPIDAIVTSWVNVERAIGRLYGRVQLVTTGNSEPNFRRKLDFLTSAGAISSSIVPEIRILSQIRNRVVHHPDEELSQDSVRTYVANAQSIVDLIDAIPGDPALQS
ncbi:hypothetical protein [Sphingobium sp. Cam5-1]|uniref:hypothetical protein n=1 Tax=Sphingobium sp. Cam5-1 TaxID=2789327 RepID=UPI0018AD1F55|nr:hypothetical protein [Sphingobium sp. Cam5-1]QPI73809.1 hypothetical protein IZV00_04885 [Sphingobium sp. Cam5-1]